MSEKFPTGKEDPSNEGIDLNALSKGADTDPKVIKAYGFDENNKYRVEKGLLPYSKEEYDQEFIKMHEEAIKSYEKDIKMQEEVITRAKSQLEKSSGEIVDIKAMLGRAVEKGQMDRVEKIKNTLQGYEMTFSEDALLDKISHATKEIEKYRNWIEESKQILAKTKQ